MGYEAYRVRRRFGWGGWEYGPKEKGCSCGCEECTGAAGIGCESCSPECICNIPPERYGGDIWIVEAGRPNKESLLERHFATGDASIPAVDELLKNEQYSRLLSPPTKPRRPKPKRELALATGIERVE